MLLQKGNVLVENLLLQVFRTRGNNDAFSVQDGRDQIRQGFSRSRPCLDEERPLVLDRRLYGFSHLQLARPVLIVGVPLREKSTRGEEAFRGERSGRRGHPYLLLLLRIREGSV